MGVGFNIYKMKIIIGASGGIGSKLFHHYSPLEGTIGTFCQNGEESESMYFLNVASWRETKRFFNRCHLYESKIVLINCAGVNYDSMAHKANYAGWGWVIDVNLKGVFNVIRTFLPYMRKQNYGRIINMSSVVAQMGVMGTSAYAASKAGLWGMTKAIAAENKDKGITINNLNLGYMDAGMALELPVEKRGSIDNIINAIDFLVDSDFVTGTSIDINGGIL